MKTIDEILDEWYPTIPNEEHNGLYARDKVKLIAQEFDDQFRKPPVSGSFPYSIYEEELNKITQLLPTQTSLMKQCEILRIFANKLGLYDAADFLENYR